MQDYLSSTNSSSSSNPKHGKWNHNNLVNDIFKNDAESLKPETQLNRQNVEKEKADTFKKYTQFMNTQNNILTQILVDRNKKSQQNSIEQELVNKLRESSNQFIKNILSQLTQAYAKIRSLKSNYDSRIKALQSQLEHTGQQNKLLRQQFYNEWEQKSQKCGSLLKFMENELQTSCQQYQGRISCLMKELQQRHINYDLLLCQKIQLGNQLMQANRVLRLEREDSNERRKQFKGMELLVLQYQEAITQCSQEIINKEQQIKQLNKKISEMEQSHKVISFQNGALKQQINVLKEETNKSNIAMQQSKCLHSKYQNQINNIRKQLTTQLKIYADNIVGFKNSQDALKLQLQQSKLKINQLQNYLDSANSQLKKCRQFIKEQRVKTKQTIGKMQKMCNRKLKLVKKAVTSKLNNLRNENQQLKQHIHRQIFKFYHQLKMELIMSTN